jgi:hypothetical protein
MVFQSEKLICVQYSILRIVTSGKFCEQIFVKKIRQSLHLNINGKIASYDLANIKITLGLENINALFCWLFLFVSDPFFPSPGKQSAHLSSKENIVAYGTYTAGRS